MSSSDEKESGVFVGHYECIGEDCESSDALAVYYGDDNLFNGYCFSCEQPFTAEDIGESYLKDELDGVEVTGKKSKRTPITREEIKEILSSTVVDDTKYRGISQEANEAYKVRTKLIDGQVVERHYPITKKGKPSAYKKRVHPKDFTKGYAGYNGKDCDLFGQSRFPSGGKYVLLVGGEEDAQAAYDMLRNDQKRRGKDHFEPVAVVSSTIGEGGISQVKNNYEYLVSFKKIVICYDRDAAGEKALEQLLKVLPVGQTFVMECPEKDPNECLLTGFENKFVRAFYAAAEHNPSGVVGSGDLMSRVIEYAKMPRLPLPSFLSQMQKMMAGGIPLGSIVSMASSSGAGKSTLTNEVLYYWVFNSPYKIGVAPLEGGVDFFAESLLSRHLSKKIALVESPEEKVSYLTEPAIIKKSDEIFYDEMGDDRFQLINGEGSLTLDIFKKRCEHMVRAMDVKVLIFDPLTKLLEDVDFQESRSFMKWQNDFVERNKCIIINIVQVRKSPSGKKANSVGAELYEEDMSGAGAILQTSFCNILFMRNKEAEDEVERNTTKLKVSKCRWSGITGPAGYMYYDNESHTLHEKDQYFLEKADEGFAEEDELFKEIGAYEDVEEKEEGF